MLKGILAMLSTTTWALAHQAQEHQMAHESSACGNQVWHLFPTTSAEGSRRYVKQVMLRSDLYQSRKQAPYTGIKVRGSWSIQLCSSHSFSQFSFHVLSFNIGQELADNWFQKKIKMSYLNVTPKNYFQMKMFCIFYEKKKAWLLHNPFFPSPKSFLCLATMVG